LGQFAGQTSRLQPGSQLIKRAHKGSGRPARGILCQRRVRLVHIAAGLRKIQRFWCQKRRLKGQLPSWQGTNAKAKPGLDQKGTAIELWRNLAIQGQGKFGGLRKISGGQRLQDLRIVAIDGGMIGLAL
jgi:hypothetical protein